MIQRRVCLFFALGFSLSLSLSLSLSFVTCPGVLASWRRQRPSDLISFLLFICFVFVSSLAPLSTDLDKRFRG